MRQEAILTIEQVDEVEKAWMGLYDTRRCTLGILTKSFKEIEQLVKDDREFALTMAAICECNRELKFYKDIKDLLERATLTASMALCSRKDFPEISTEAKAEIEAEAIA